MTTSWESLLRAPHRCDHVAQLYTDEAFLGRAVGEFVLAGIERGEGVVVIATSSHVAAFAERLAAHRLAVADLLDARQLLVFDAARCLTDLMDGDMPDADRFHAFVTGIGERVTRAGYRTVRFYGEMVDLLWSRNLAGALRMEELWSQALARQERATLLCAYRIDVFDRDVQRSTLPRVAQAHSHVVPVEDYARYEAAIAQAHEEVFGALGEATAFRELLVSSYPSASVMPQAHAAVLALAAVDPMAADDLLQRARRYYRTADAPCDRRSASLGPGAASPTLAPSTDGRRVVMMGVRVLVAADDPEALLAFAYALRTCQAEVITVDNARSALEAALTLRPDIIVSDVAVRDGGGDWLLQSLRASGQQDAASVPVLAIMTADGQSRTGVLSSGFHDTLTKPVDPDDLCRAVARLARR